MRNFVGQLKFTFQTTYEHKDDHVENFSKGLEREPWTGCSVGFLKKRYIITGKVQVARLCKTAVGDAAVSADDNDDGSGSCLHSLNVYLCCNNITSVISF